MAEGDEDDRVAAALAAGVEALDGDAARADELLAPIEDPSGLVSDYVWYFQGVAKQRLGDDEAARERFERTIAARPSSPVALKAAARLAPMLSGARARVLELADRYASGSGPSTDAAVIALAAGEALADSDPRRAAEWLLRARRLAPGTAPGSEAASLLSDLRRTSPALKPTTAESMLEEARLTAREGDRGAQAALLDGILARHPREPQAADAAILRARMIAADKGRPEAAAWLEERAERATTSHAKARLLFTAASDRWNIDDTNTAQAIFARVTTLGSAPEAQRSHYALGRIHEADGRYTSAALSYHKASTGPDAEVARESRWRAGWVAYLGGDAALAASRFADIASDAAAAEPAREEAMYWQARALERAQDKPRAQLVYRQLIEKFPDGFYAYLAEPRAGVRAPAPIVVASDSEAMSAESAAAVRRAAILESARLHDYAIEELRHVLSRASAGEQRALLPAFMRIGAYEHALQSALTLYRRGDLTEQQLYPYLYPHAFADVVDREARARGIDPYLVYSLIRQESLFDRRAVSPASAYGLMQLLLSTARRMAADDVVLSGLGREDLFRPEVNIRLGVAYLADLAARFDNNEVFMLAGYNAGEQAAERWRDAPGRARSRRAHRANLLPRDARLREEGVAQLPQLSPAIRRRRRGAHRKP